MLRPRRLLALASTAAALLAGAGALPAVAPADTVDTTPLLSVVGQGTAFVTPDTADIAATVERTTTTAAAAREDVARRTSALLRALTGLGIDRADVTTTSVSVSRQSFRKPPKVRYHAASSISVHLTDASKAGATLDALTAAGADDVDGPNFGFSDPSAGQPQAEAAALTDARARADAAAAAVGLHVVGVRSIDLDPDSGVTPFPQAAAAPAAASAPVAKSTPTPVQNGRQQVSATVAVVFVLG